MKNLNFEQENGLKSIMNREERITPVVKPNLKLQW